MEALGEDRKDRPPGREQAAMSHFTSRACHKPLAAALVAAAFLLSAGAARAQQVVVMVSGEPITALDIEHRTKLIQMSGGKVASRKEVIDELIDEILKTREAKRFGIVVPDAEVDRNFAALASRMSLTSQKLIQALTANGTSAESLKRRLRAEVAWGNLVRGRYKATLEIRDRDVETALEINKADEKEDIGYEYVLRPVVMIVPRGSAEAAYEAKKRDADALRARFQTCAEGIPFARALKEVAVRDQVTRFSADLPPPLRAILDNTPVGHLTPPEVADDGIQMFALCSRRETTSDTPGKRKVRQEMFNEKFQKQSKRYLEELRRAAMIEYK
jgi:peptidyl-prolyl cis-trans isomerase SurA